MYLCLRGRGTIKMLDIKTCNDVSAIFTLVLCAYYTCMYGIIFSAL